METIHPLLQPVPQVSWRVVTKILFLLPMFWAGELGCAGSTHLSDLCQDRVYLLCLRKYQTGSTAGQTQMVVKLLTPGSILHIDDTVEGGLTLSITHVGSGQTQHKFAFRCLATLEVVLDLVHLTSFYKPDSLVFFW